MISYPSYHNETDLSESRFLVTGGAGFIGSHLVDYLVLHKAGAVRVADNLSTGNLENIRHHIDSGAVEFVEADLSDPVSCAKVVHETDHVFHQAALGSIPRSVQYPSGTHEANVNGFFYLLEAARKAEVKHFIFASSSSVYGDNTTFPRPEEALGNPLSPYAVSKRINELYGQVYHRVYGLHTTGLRYFNIFGPRQKPDGPYAAAIPKFLDKMTNGEAPVVFGDGNQTRDFTFVKNAVQANIRAFVSPGAAGGIFNIGLGNETRINDLLNILRELMPGAPEPIHEPARKGDVARSRAEIEKAVSMLNYQPDTQFNEGLIKTVEWFKNRKA